MRRLFHGQIMATILPEGKQSFTNSAGDPLAGGKLYTYAAGTSTPKATYADSGAVTPNANPIVMDARGEATIFWDGVYKVILKDSADSLVWTVDNISSTGDSVPLATLASSAGSSLVGFLQAGTGAVARTAQSKMRDIISVKDFGAAGNGSDDDTAEIQSAIDYLSASGGAVVFPFGTYKTTSAITIYSNVHIIGDGFPTIHSATAGKNIFSGSGISNVLIENIKFTGTGSSTAPTVSVGGYLTSSTGLVTIVNSSNITISQCEFGDFYNGISLIKCLQAQVTNNYIHNWMLYGILGSISSGMSIDFNRIIGCDQTAGVSSYGVMITGDNAGGNPSSANSISHNVIWNIPAWDGIMTHDCDALKIIGNDIRDVRMGIDASISVATTINDIQIASNYVKSTTTDCWAGVGAVSAGILFSGYDSTHLASGVTITGNIIDSFFNMSGSPVYSGSPSHISCGYCDYINVTGNIIKNGGSSGSVAAIYSFGKSNNVCITGNMSVGTMPSGGIRLASAVSDSVTIVGNSIIQSNSADPGIYITGSTISILTVEGNSSNSTSKYSVSGSTIASSSANSGSIQSAQTYSVTALANLTSTLLPDFTVSGAISGDVAMAFTSATIGVYFNAIVVAVDTVRITIFNASGVSLTAAGSPITITVVKFRQ